MKHYTFAVPIPYILIGEEGILYGKPAIGMALSYFISVKIEESSTQSVPDIYKNLIVLVDTFLRKYLQIDDSIKPYYSLTIISDLPIKNSQVQAATIVGLVAALSEFYTHKIPSQSTINKIAYSIEKKLNAKSNGLYISVCTFGGIVYYRKEFEFLKAVHSLPINIPHAFLGKISLQLTKVKPITLNRIMNDDFEQFQDYLNKLEKYTKRIILSFIKEDFKFFKETFDAYIHLRDTVSDLTYDKIFAINENMLLKYGRQKKDMDVIFSKDGIKKKN
jgi:mevalonate kinase